VPRFLKNAGLIFSATLVFSSIVFAEDITITTYYPSPYGSYNDLTANQMKIGSTYSDSGTAFESNGLLVEGKVIIGATDDFSHYVDASDAKLIIQGKASGASEFGSPNDYALASFEDDVNRRGLSIGHDAVNDWNWLYSRYIGVGTYPLNIRASKFFFTGGNVGIGTTSPTHQLQLSTDSAAKPNTNTWTIVSDQRIKKNILDFTDGLNVIMKLKPRT
jgi:hypothetical protein